jgi:hypothetical protein
MNYKKKKVSSITVNRKKNLNIHPQGCDKEIGVRVLFWLLT